MDIRKEKEANGTGLERREFLTGAASVASASLLGRASEAALLNRPVAAPPDESAPAMPATTERRVKRWQEQRWILDAVIQTVGVEWDQARIAYTLGPCGVEATADFNGVRARVRKFNDISREYARAASRREKMARQFEDEKRMVAARENYFIAALLYGSAQWPIYENTHENVALNEKKNTCYQKYMQHADHEIRRAEIPFEGKSLPGYFHLPASAAAARLPCVVVVGGMDSIKEIGCALYGDKLLSRGIAVLAVEGPGQGECNVRDIYVTAQSWFDAGKAILSWVRAQKDVDPDRVALRGQSMGSFFCTQVAAIDDRIKGVAVQAMCHEPGMNTLFNMASPTFKLRFMYMAGYQDEPDFDKFARTLSLRDTGEKIKCPYLAVAGEDDHLSPIEYTYDLLDTISAPKQMLLYEGADHGVGNASSVALGPSSLTFIAEWLNDRLDGKPMATKHMKVDAIGHVHESTFAEARTALF
jgi:dienelactone hydrolase